MEDIKIRKAVLSDIPYFYEICLKTGNNGKDATELFSDPYLIGNYFAAPYLFYSDGICFVAESENRPQGYIVAVPDTISYFKWMEETWLPPLRERYAKSNTAQTARSANEERIFYLIHGKKYPPDDSAKKPNDYPAHFHIDLLPSLQGKGIGSKLMETLYAELRQRGVPGLHMGVSAANETAVGFYQKLGFTVLKNEEWGFTMGIKIPN